MEFILAYFALGAVAFVWLYARTKNDVIPASTMLMGDGIGLLICAIFWPVMVPLSLIDNRIQEEEFQESENKEEYTPEDLGLLKGKIGETLTPQNLSGKVSIEGKEYESRSVISHIQKGEKIRVVGHSMRHLNIEPAEPDARSNANTAPMESSKLAGSRTSA